VDKAALVASDLEVEGLVVAALSRSQIPVTAVDWHWVAEIEEWQLVVVTSLHDAKGPREAYARVIEALSLAGVYQIIPIRKLFVKSPQDPSAQRLVRELKLITEGSIHILRHPMTGEGAKYSVVFAPYLGTGGPIPSIPLVDENDLREFLEKRVGIDSYAVREALDKLSAKRSTSIPNVPLSLRQAKRLKLVA
jgi:hypothetical protein